MKSTINNNTNIKKIRKMTHSKKIHNNKAQKKAFINNKMKALRTF